MKYLAALSAFLDIVLRFLTLYVSARERAVGRQQAREQIQAQETEANARAEKVLAERRSPDAAADRLRHGTF